MANYTEHYQLHQWEPSDSFLRTDFNQDFARIDTGMRAAKAQAERLEREKAEISTGLYRRQCRPAARFTWDSGPERFWWRWRLATAMEATAAKASAAAWR